MTRSLSLRELELVVGGGAGQDSADYNGPDQGQDTTQYGHGPDTIEFRAAVSSQAFLQWSGQQQSSSGSPSLQQYMAGLSGEDYDSGFATQALQQFFGSNGFGQFGSSSDMADIIVTGHFQAVSDNFWTGYNLNNWLDGSGCAFFGPEQTSQQTPAPMDEDVTLFGHTIHIHNNTPGDPASADAIGKIETALGLIISHGGSVSSQQQFDLSQITEIVYSGTPGRSSTAVNTGVFTVSSSDLAGLTASQFATELVHEATHVEQWNAHLYDSIVYTNDIPNAGASMQMAVNLEKQATNAQIAFAQALGVDINYINYLTGYAADNNQEIEQRLGQHIAN